VPNPVATDPPATPSGTDVVAVVRAALATLAPEGVRTGARAVTDADLLVLHPDEQEIVERAVEARRREFATGRALLRSLLGTAGALPRTAISRTAWRAPLLPAGTCGSLAHDHDLAVAAVAATSAAQALGIDLEAQQEIDARTAAVIRRDDDGDVDVALVFAAKEAVYKAWCGLEAARTGTAPRVLEFHDVRLTVTPSTPHAGSFTGSVLAAGDELSGRYVAVAGRWLTLVTVP
jgi:4'-phosphopantetheinyl transferase EntD